MTLDEMTGAASPRGGPRAPLRCSEFSIVFIALGAGATVAGYFSCSLSQESLALARIGGALIIVFGLYTIGVLRLAWFDRDRRLHLDRKPAGFLGSALVGMTFAAGWTPCIGPILGGILTLAGNTSDVRRGIEQLAA